MTEALASAVERHCSSVEAAIGVGYKDLGTGEEFYREGDTAFPAASTFKIPLLFALYAAVERGLLSLEDEHQLSEEELSLGSGLLASLEGRPRLPLSDYAFLMMAISDNSATDLIYRLVGRKALEETVRGLGLRETRCDLDCDELVRTACSIPLDLGPREARERLQTQAVCNEPFYTDLSGPNNVSCPRDMVTMLSRLHEGRIVSAKASEEMLGIMKRCQTNARIPYWLPEDATVAHKTGTLNAVACDSGIVYHGAGAYVVSFFVNGHNASQEERRRNKEEHLYDRLLADLSRDILNAFRDGRP